MDAWKASRYRCRRAYTISKENRAMKKKPEGKVILSAARCWRSSLPSELNRKTLKARWRMPLGVSVEKMWQFFLGKAGRKEEQWGRKKKGLAFKTTKDSQKGPLNLVVVPNDVVIVVKNNAFVLDHEIFLGHTVSRPLKRRVKRWDRQNKGSKLAEIRTWALIRCGHLPVAIQSMDETTIKEYV